MSNERKTGAGLAAANGSDLCAWEVSVKGTDWKKTVNARTAGQAKSDYHMDVLDAWPDVPYTAMRCRKIGAPHTSERFAHNARYRGLPDVKCGQRVKVGDAFGVIVGHNSSANFDVLFDVDSKYRGMKLNCHPDSCEMVNGQKGRDQRPGDQNA